MHELCCLCGSKFCFRWLEFFSWFALCMQPIGIAMQFNVLNVWLFWLTCIILHNFYLIPLVFFIIIRFSHRCHSHWMFWAWCFCCFLYSKKLRTRNSTYHLCGTGVCSNTVTKKIDRTGIQYITSTFTSPNVLRVFIGDSSPAYYIFRGWLRSYAVCCEYSSMYTLPLSFNSPAILVRFLSLNTHAGRHCDIITSTFLQVFIIVHRDG